MTLGKRCLLISCAAVVFAGFGLAFAGSAAAQDLKTYPGSQCQPKKTGDSWVYNGGAIFNNDDRRRVFVCPLLQDGPFVFEEIEAVFLAVTVYHSGKDDFVCTLYSRTEDGELFDMWSEVIESDEEEGLYQLLLAVGNPEAFFDDEAFYGIYELRCQTPEDSAVLSYAYGEESPTDEGELLE